MKQLFNSFKGSSILLLACCCSALAQTRLNQTQVIGTHNSYKVAIDEAVADTLRAINPLWAERFAYSHEPIRQQLDRGLANLELDIAVDRNGGKYSRPKLYEALKDKHQLPVYNADGVMDLPGFKVLHVQDIDFRSHCPTLSDCLAVLRHWSDANPKHHPVFITVNAKDRATEGLPTVPDLFTEEDFRQLDDQLLRELGHEKLLTPRDVQGAFASLEEAVLLKGWPTMEQSAGKFLFILDEKEEKREIYLRNRSAHKVFFVDAPEGNPNAAVMVVNNPKSNLERIQYLVKRGYLVRTRADADTYEARRNDFSRFEAAKASGAQIITTDYYLTSTHFASRYFVQFSNGKYIQENPVLQAK